MIYTAVNDRLGRFTFRLDKRRIRIINGKPVTFLEGRSLGNTSKLYRNQAVLIRAEHTRLYTRGHNDGT